MASGLKRHPFQKKTRKRGGARERLPSGGKIRKGKRCQGYESQHGASGTPKSVERAMKKELKLGSVADRGQQKNSNLLNPTRNKQQSPAA